MTKFEAFVNKYKDEIRHNKPDNIRHGQFLMKLLYNFDRVQYDRISSIYYHDRTDIDCYYKDELIPNTLKHLKSEWGETSIY